MILSMLKAGSGVAAPFAAWGARASAVALVILWPFTVFLPINFTLALAVGLPYAALAIVLLLIAAKKGWI